MNTSASWLYSNAQSRPLLAAGALLGFTLLGPSGLAETITFDDPGYLAGNRPPVPWTDSYAARGDMNHSASFSVVSGQGVGGSQCLSVGYTGLWEGYAVYMLPRPLTPADGAQRISVKYNPPGNTSYNFTQYGAAMVGNGWMQISTGVRRGFVFKLQDWHYSYPHHASEFQITCSNPAGTGDSVAGYFVADPGLNYYELIFDMDATWTNMTLIVVPPSGPAITNTTVWNGSAIDKVWLGECGASTYDVGNATYDDLVIGSDTLSLVAPTVGSQPQSQTTTPGTAVAFTVWAAGSAPFSYQWRKDGSDLAEGGNVLGNSWPILTLTNLSVGDSGDYTVVITNAAGSTTSQVARLTVQVPPPIITQQPQSQSVTIGNDVRFSVAAVGTGNLAYHWQKNGFDLNNNERTSGVNTTNLAIASLVPSDAGDFRVIVASASGAVTSEVAILTVNTLTQFPAGLVALWPGEGNANDIVGTSHGTLVGATFAAGHTGQAFSLDGSGWVSFPESPSIDLSRMANWTMTAWVNPASFGNSSYPTVYSEGRWGASLGLQGNSGLVESWFNNSGVAHSSSAVTLNQWSHVAIVYDGVNVRFYINGLASGISPAPAVSPDSTGSALGSVTDGSGNSKFQGLVDDMALYNRALTPAEIQTVASLVVNPSPAAFNSISNLSANTFQLSFTVASGRTNVLQASTNLLDWVELIAYPPTNGTILFFDTNGLSKRFYRMYLP